MADVADVAPPCGDVEAPEIRAVDEDHARRGVVEAEEERDDP